MKRSSSGSKVARFVLILLVSLYSLSAYGSDKEQGVKEASKKAIKDYVDAAYSLIRKTNPGRKDYEQAFEIAKKAQELDPFDFKTCLLTGVIYYNLGKFPEAEYWLECAERKNPNSILTSLNSLKDDRERLQKKVDAAFKIIGTDDEELRKQEETKKSLHAQKDSNLPIPNLGSPPLSNLDERQGFRKIKWGTFVEDIGDLTPTKCEYSAISYCFVREGDDLNEYGVLFDKIEYQFDARGYFHSVDLLFKGRDRLEKFNRIAEVMTTKFGLPSEVLSMIYWEIGEGVVISLDYTEAWKKYCFLRIHQ